jgi:hypothetical protein
MSDIIPADNTDLLMQILSNAQEHLVNAVEIQEQVAQLPQVEIPIFHHFAPNIYMRQMEVVAGTLMVTKMHKTEHFLIVLKGSATILDSSGLMHVQAPQVIKTQIGTKRVIYFHEDSAWLTTHPTSETDLNLIEDQLIVPDDEINQFLKSIEVSA